MAAHYRQHIQHFCEMIWILLPQSHSVKLGLARRAPTAELTAFLPFFKQFGVQSSL